MKLCNFWLFLRKIDTLITSYQKSRFYYKKRAGSKQLPYGAQNSYDVWFSQYESSVARRKILKKTKIFWKC